MLDTERGDFHVAGVPGRTGSWADSRPRSPPPTAWASPPSRRTSSPASPTWPFGAHVAVVEVDTETGQVELRRMICVDDCGTILNPLLVEGQRHGGVAQGAAQAICEEFAYDDDGNPVTDNFVNYPIVSAAELPTFELVGMATPTPVNPLGAKGIGESGRSARRRRRTTRSSTRCRTSACAMSTCRRPRSGCGEAIQAAG